MHGSQQLHSSADVTQSPFLTSIEHNTAEETAFLQVQDLTALLTWLEPSYNSV